MISNLKKIDCAPECGFMVRSHDENEIVNLALTHLSNIHNQRMTPVEIRGKIEPA
jgi:predicted small metal-binding protein